MRPPDPAEVESVAPESPAAREGLSRGDRIVRVNGKAPRDYIDYRYLAAESEVRLVVAGADGRRRRVTIDKGVDEDLGLRFTEDVFDGVITCGNRCPFCFVQQLPKGLRPALYVRDDDYRLSFLHGNFITLTNLTPADRARIVRQHLSPLYVSVQATEPEVRRAIFGRESPEVLPTMRSLAARGIEFHCQIVVCPGINDGDHLERTVRELAALYPGVGSIGIVPVGLTKHRRLRPQVRPVRPALACAIIERVREWQGEFRRRLGTRLVFGSDELYVLSGISFPGRAEYEGFPQLGNGIGCARLFLEGIGRIRPPRLGRRLSVTLVTGEMAAPLVRRLAERLEEGEVSARVCVVENRLLGRTVTTAGLLAGEDILRALRGGEGSEAVIVPGTAVREEEGFIDGVTPQDIAARTGVPVLIASTPAQASAAIRRLGRRKDRRWK